jgi:hypothetical protein
MGGKRPWPDFALGRGRTEATAFGRLGRAKPAKQRPRLVEVCNKVELCKQSETIGVKVGDDEQDYTAPCHGD